MCSPGGNDMPGGIRGGVGLEHKAFFGYNKLHAPTPKGTMSWLKPLKDSTRGYVGSGSKSSWSSNVNAGSLAPSPSA